MKQLKVDAIKNGTVIDHIQAGKGLIIADFLKTGRGNVMMIGMNLQSKSFGKKDIIKIENKTLTSIEMSSIALISPKATITKIKDFKIEGKKKVELQNEIESLIICPNPKCITNMDEVNSVFYVTQDENNVVRCKYCEKKYSVDEIKIRI
ncbi:MAG: aspartate carbamoyltransferase regulatory subunit [Candidatus Cloacimonetes bacterium]|nr:aspartate carbamoyltransferase regulatory subunit [Candidatus Cloacimonadota bacterium]